MPKDPNCILRRTYFEYEACRKRPRHYSTSTHIYNPCGRHQGSRPSRSCYTQTVKGSGSGSGSNPYVSQRLWTSMSSCPECEETADGAPNTPKRSEKPRRKMKRRGAQKGKSGKRKKQQSPSQLLCCCVQ